MIRINPYEIMLLIEPEVAEERHTEIIERTKATVTEGGGTWHGVEPWGKRKLAYEINHLTDAFYYVLTFDAPVPALEEATRVLRITDGVLRFMAVAKPPPKAAAAGAGRAGRGVGLTHRPVTPLLYTNVRSQEEAEEEPVANINRVILTGNLTADPELSTLPSGTSVCRLRLAVNRRYKDQSSGEWIEKPNYFDIKVWGAQGENCAQYLSKGRPVAVDGRLEWREWEAQDGGKRSAVEVVADTVQFLGSRGDSSGEAGGGFRQTAEIKPEPVEAFTGAAASDDDIPF